MRLSSGFFSLPFALALLLLVAAGCGKSDDKSEGPAEKAGATMGRAIDQAVEKARPTVEKAGEQLKEAAGKLKEEATQAVDKLKERVNKNDEKTNDQKQ
jgi:gas vesicle protein